MREDPAVLKRILRAELRERRQNMPAHERELATQGFTSRLQELVGSTGVGLRLVTPFALFRLDYGRTIWNRPVDDSGRVVFGIGQTF